MLETTLKKTGRIPKSQTSRSFNSIIMARKMKDGKFAEEGKAFALASDKIPCVNCKKILIYNKTRAIHTYSSKGLLGKKDHKQFCSWKCAEQYHG